MKILVSSKSFGKEDSRAIKMLIDAGFEPVINPYNKALTQHEFSRMIQGAVGLIAGTEKIDRNLLKEANNLKVISRFGVGTDNIDLEAAKNKGIIVCNTPEAPTMAVAELTLSLILNLNRRISEVDRNLHSGIWKPVMGTLLNGKTIGIIGLGRIGRELVKLVEPFKLKLIAYDLFPDNDFISKYNIKMSSIENLLVESDIITLHLPLTSETRHFIGKKEFSLMKRDSIIINTARGELIDENELINALENKSIGGAAIDVFGVEPYDGKLKEYNNVILTPHIGSYTKETRLKMEQETVDNLINALSMEGIK